MCNNFRETDKTEVVGWKVVLKDKKPGRYRSALTNKLYPLNRRMPSGEAIQGNLDFYNTILDSPSGYFFRDDLIGRTSVFCDLESAQDCLVSLKDLSNLASSKSKKLVVVVQCRLSDDLLAAEYDSHNVFCGRRLEILEEVE